MRRGGAGRLVVALAVLALLSGAAAQSWGVRVDVDVPLDASLAAYLANPLGYAAAHRDALDARGFVEFERFGFETRWRSSTEAFAGAYVILSRASLLGQSSESTIGVYVGRDFRAGATFVALRGSLLLYGRLP